ncbi:hypothetical protein DL96DRAFT_1825531 [Flagelloscypha sp. PMI_526]|nr:hypothetical protein DL96DRAFT_1825531 [Flagelloscypha sp. PMI_526]
MAERGTSTREREGITALALDGSLNPLDALSELYILQETAGRWAFSQGLELRGDEARPMDMFDIIGGTGIGGFYAVLFARLKMTIQQAIQCHGILEQRLFSSDAWKNKAQQACVETLRAVLDEIVQVLKIETSLDLPFEEKTTHTKCFVCTINPAAPSSCRLLRNYRPRTDQSPRCTIRQVLHATLSNHVQLPAVLIEEERFLSALDRYANPTHVLVKELGNAYIKGTHVSCLANVGAGDLGFPALRNPRDVEEFGGLLRSCHLVADDVASQCHGLGPFFFRFSFPFETEEASRCAEKDISRVKGLTVAYLSVDDMSTQLDSLEELLRKRSGVVSVDRLNSVAGKDGESRVEARLAKIEGHLDGTLFQDVKKWLKPVHQTSKLDANIRARSGTTCQWLLKNETFMKWMEKKCGLFWFRGLMGTGKTVMSSFVIETLLAQCDVYVAYYYFEFTNPTTLSEEAILRSLGSLQPQLATLQDALNELVLVSAKPVFIIIDALDELPLAQRKYFLQSLVTFSTSNHASRSHIMVTSREEVDIHRAFQGEVDFELAVQGDLVRQDIAAFVDQELAAQKWTHWPRYTVEMTRRLLNKRADGQFRMVACQVDILQQAKTFEQLQRSLHFLPKTLSETYSYILEKIPDDLRDQAHRLFGILSFALKPTSTRELSALLAVELGEEEDSNQLSVLQEKNQMVDPLDVVDLGTSLVSRIDHFGKASLLLAHASVKEHLLISSNTWFSLCEDLAHSMIARSCLALLVHFQVLQRKSREIWFRDARKSAVAPSYPYSKSKWFKHVLPNGSPQLLWQQQQIYKSFPWPCIDSNGTGPYQEGLSPLESAAFASLFDLVETFLNARSWETEYLNKALIVVVSSERDELVSIQCCHSLLTHGADVNAFTGPRTVPFFFDHERLFPLQAAASKGNVKMVGFLLGKGADVNASGGIYGLALQAAYCSSLEIVRFLVEKGADVNARGGLHGSALQASALCGSLEIVRFLVENRADVNASGGEYDSALQAGASRGRLEIVRFLVEKGAHVNAVVRGHDTALISAQFSRVL